MSKANRLYLVLIGVVLVAGLFWFGQWFMANFEQQSREVRTGVSPEARKNRFLAAEHFLKRIGQDAQSHAGRDIFSLNPSTDDTIVLGSHSGLFLERNHEQLMKWVQDGGHLILVPDADTAFFEDDEAEKETYPLLERLGVELVLVDEVEKEDDLCNDDVEPCEEETASADDDKPADGEPDSDTQKAAIETDEDEDTENPDVKEDNMVTVTFRSSHTGEFKAQFLADRFLLDAEGLADVVVGETEKPNLLRYTLENGSVTVLSDMLLFTNNAIGKFDHAYLLSRLVNGPGKIWIFYSAEMPTLPALLWKKAPYLVMIATVLLLMAGWRMLRNSGPQLRPRYDSRRNLLEHLDATAEYNWRIGKASKLFNDNRHAVEQAWRRRHPQLSGMNQAERCEWIGENAGIAASAVERTLYGEVGTEQDFIRATAVMQRLAMQVNRITDTTITKKDQ